MNGATRLGLGAKDSSDSCDLGAFTESERVVRSWSRLKCGTAHTVRYATFEERRAAAVHADVQRCTELRFSAFQWQFSEIQQVWSDESARNPQFGHPKLWRAAHGCTTHAHGGWAPSAQV